MSNKNQNTILEAYPDSEFIFADGFDNAIVGVADRIGSESIICYDKEKIYNQLMKDGMTREEAIEYFDFNIGGAFVGDKTPIFIDLIQNMDV